jgi:hypothetical protein
MPPKKVLLTSAAVILAILAVEVVIYFLLPPSYQPQFFRFIGYSILAMAYVVIIVDLIFLIPTIKGAIYFPSSDQQIATILKLAKLKKGEKAVDIGSGDGRIPFALAKAGAQAYGYEINLILVLWSMWQARLLPASQRPHFKWANMWTSNFGDYDVITLFGMTYIMKDLEKKLMREVKPGAKVICNSFPFPNWKPTKKEGSVYLYEKKL